MPLIVIDLLRIADASASTVSILHTRGTDVWELNGAALQLDTVDFPAVFLGAMKAGLVAVPVNTLLTTEDYSLDNTSWSVFGTVDFEPIEGLVR